MAINDELADVNPPLATGAFPSGHVANGAPIPKPLRVSIFSPDQWETFVEEWASSLKVDYFKVARSGGAGDKGLDVICFATAQLFAAAWDNYQCKRYDHPLGFYPVISDGLERAENF